MELLYEAEARKRAGMPVVTRKFAVIAKLAKDRLKSDADSNRGLRKHADYASIIDRYLLPFFGKYNVSSIDNKLLDEFDMWRADKMGKLPSRSTLPSHNAALNRVFDEAEFRGFLNSTVRPKLSAKKGSISNRRPVFTEEEVCRLLGGFDAWIENKRNGKNRELALLLRDYVWILLDTGARPGTELLGLKWEQIEYTSETFNNGISKGCNEDGTPDICEKDGSQITDARLRLSAG